MCAANPQDESAMSMMEMVTGDNIGPYKFAKESFTKHLNFEPLNYCMFIETMLELT